jgi:3-methyladenine DNA glycosylase AlkD
MAAVTAALAKRALHQFGSAERATFVAGFFKTGKGEYGEGDVFMGASVPECRLVAKEFRALPLAEIEKLIVSRIHEERLTGLFILVSQFQRAKDEALRKKLFGLYRKRMAYVNNWDLVDLTAPNLVGVWLADKPRNWLDELAVSKNVWYRRIAMVATFHFIRQGESKDAIRIAGALVGDKHDLIQKAVGWMLREVEKRASAPALETFLKRHAATMPRTMLRYAIERLSPGEKEKWMGMAASRAASRSKRAVRERP